MMRKQRSITVDTNCHSSISCKRCSSHSGTSRYAAYCYLLLALQVPIVIDDEAYIVQGSSNHTAMKTKSTLGLVLDTQHKPGVLSFASCERAQMTRNATSAAGWP